MKRIIVTRLTTQGGILTLGVVLWYPVVVGDEVPLPGSNSAYREASQAELDALRAGTVKEETDSYRFPMSTTETSLKTFLRAVWTDRKNFLDSNPAEGKHYGTFDDSITGWSA